VIKRDAISDAERLRLKRETAMRMSLRKDDEGSIRLSPTARRSYQRALGLEQESRIKDLIELLVPPSWLAQLRVQPSALHDTYYLGALRAGREVPAATVRFGRGEYHIVDGNHRIGAAVELQLPLRVNFLISSTIATEWRASRLSEGFRSP
jgi:hypothetical protein